MFLPIFNGRKNPISFKTKLNKNSTEAKLRFANTRENTAKKQSSIKWNKRK